MFAFLHDVDDVRLHASWKPLGHRSSFRVQTVRDTILPSTPIALQLLSRDDMLARAGSKAYVEMEEQKQHFLKTRQVEAAKALAVKQEVLHIVFHELQWF